MGKTNAPRIAVVTVNPGIDRTMYFDLPLERGEVNRAVRTVTDQGCKSGNAAIVLSRLGADVTYFTFTGGELGALYESFLQKEALRTVVIPTAAGVRMNVKLSDGTSFTECNQKGGPVSECECEAMLQALREAEFDCLYLAGSLPQGMPCDFYAACVKIARQKGGYVVADCDGEVLEKTLQAAPDLCKPNRTELERLIPEGDSLSAKITRFCEKYPQTVLLLSLGSEGAILVDQENMLKAKALPARVRGTVAAGDTFLSAFTVSVLRGEARADALKKATAAAAAKVALEGTALPSAAQMQERIQEVTVSKFQNK